MSVFDVLDINPENPEANVIGDLHDLQGVADGSYDCAIVTHTLQYLHDPRLGVHELHRILAPGGSALVTAPCLGRPGITEFADADGVDYWRFMPAGLSMLFGDLSWDVEMSLYGNALIGTAIWHGMSVGDLPAKAFQVRDPAWPCVAGIRARKPAR